MSHTQHLHGMLILDCSTLLPGPLIGKLLAQQGARVIKIENPDSPDGARLMGTFYEDLNRDKELVFLNLKTTEGQRKFHELVKQAHGLIEGFRPAAKKKLRLDADNLHRLNPKLCIASLIGYPEAGPWAERAGHDMNFQALSGCLSLFNELPALPLADLFAAYEGAFKLSAALHSCSQGALGSRVVVSMFETLKNVQSTLINEYRASGIVPKPGETIFSGQFPCYHIYTAADGRRIAVGAIETKFWKKVCEILGLPELTNQGYATEAHGKSVIQKVEQAFKSQPWSQWAPLFENADCCVEPVLDYSEAYPDGV